MKKATKQEVLEMAMNQETKYQSLVWYARSGRNIDNPDVKHHRDWIEELYSKEIENLSGDDGDWFHGFNSGMLAGMRLITSMMLIDVEHATENFPELDS